MAGASDGTTLWFVQFFAGGSFECGKSLRGRNQSAGLSQRYIPWHGNHGQEASSDGTTLWFTG